LVTPNCELITPESAGQGDLTDIIFRSGDRFQMYMIGRDFVQNTANPTSPRFGPWTLVITGLSVDSNPEVIRERASVFEVENYAYNIMVESDLRMELSLDKGIYYAGDPIAVSANLTAEGKPLLGAMVSLSTTAPGQAFANWLAGLDIPADALAKAREFLAGKDSTPLLIKTVAAGFAGLKFDPTKRQGVLPMTDPGGIGLYQTIITNTSTPELYTFYVTAIGVTADGVNFQREGKLSTHVRVWPNTAFTRLEMQFGELGSGQVVVDPRDSFSNVLLVDPLTFPGFDLSVQGGSFTGPLVSNLDGTYGRGLKFDPRATLVVGVTFGGKTIQQTTLPPVGNLRWADKVIKFILGAEAERGANQHRDPHAALGDVFRKPSETFVSLGAAGVLTLAFDDLVILAAADNDVTVFVHPDTDPRPYRVEAFVPLPDISEKRPHLGPTGWVSLGDSAGGTQSFSLHKANVAIAVAIRVIDLSLRTRDKQWAPLSGPGVGVQGGGVLKISDHVPWGLPHRR
jgi:hypothetical protein